MAGETITAADYIKHHLQSLTSLSDVTQGQGLKNIADFSFINLDAVFFAVLLGVIGSFLLWRGAKKQRQAFPDVSRPPWKSCSSLWTICVRASFTAKSLEKPSRRWV